jgi:hypothetical protein
VIGGQVSEQTDDAQVADLFLPGLSDILSLLPSQIFSISDSRADLAAKVKTRTVMESLMDVLISTISMTPALSSLARKARLFLSLVLARHTSANDPCEILDLAIKLADMLHTDLVSLQDQRGLIGRPFDVHLYTLSTLSLLELADTGDGDITKPSRDAIAKLHQALKGMLQRGRDHRQNRLDDAESEHAPFLAWPDALLQLIDAKGAIADRSELPSKSVSVSGPTSSKKSPTDGTQSGAVDVSMTGDGEDTTDTTTAAAATNTNDEAIQLINSRQQYLLRRLSAAAELQQQAGSNGSKGPDRTKMTVIDFSLLTREGYLNVLADLSGF